MVGGGSGEKRGATKSSRQNRQGESTHEGGNNNNREDAGQNRGEPIGKCTNKRNK